MLGWLIAGAFAYLGSQDAKEKDKYGDRRDGKHRYSPAEMRAAADDMSWKLTVPPSISEMLRQAADDAEGR